MAVRATAQGDLGTADQLVGRRRMAQFHRRRTVDPCTQRIHNIQQQSSTADFTPGAQLTTNTCWSSNFGYLLCSSYSISPRIGTHVTCRRVTVWKYSNQLRLTIVRVYKIIFTYLLTNYMTSSAKPEVHNMSQRRLMRTEPATAVHRQRAQKFGGVWPCCFRVTRADRQTNRHTHHNTSHTSWRTW